jgi:hypothetical protein
MDAVGGAENWAATIGTAHKAPRTSVLKAVVMRQAAMSLMDAGVDATVDLRAAVANESRLPIVRGAWVRVHGLGKVSWDYLLMLAGEDGVKADTMVRRFVAEAIGLNGMVADERAHAAVRSAAAALG